jgi:hypothetical protein
LYDLFDLKKSSSTFSILLSLFSALSALVVVLNKSIVIRWMGLVTLSVLYCVARSKSKPKRRIIRTRHKKINGPALPLDSSTITPARGFSSESPHEVFRILIFADLLLGGGLLAAAHWNQFSHAFSFLLVFIGSCAKIAPLRHSFIACRGEYTPLSGLLYYALIPLSCFAPLFEVYAAGNFSSALCVGLIIIGAITALAAKFLCFYNEDMRKILSLENVAAIGVVFVLLGFNFVNTAVYALLFISLFNIAFVLLFNNIINIMSGEQSICKMGRLFERSKLTCALMLLLYYGSLMRWFAIDLICPEALYSKALSFQIIFFFFFLLHLVSSWKTIVAMFNKKTSVDEQVDAHIKEAPFAVQFPIVICFFGAIWYAAHSCLKANHFFCGPLLTPPALTSSATIASATTATAASIATAAAAAAAPCPHPHISFLCIRIVLKVTLLALLCYFVSTTAKRNMHKIASIMNAKFFSNAAPLFYRRIIFLLMRWRNKVNTMTQMYCACIKRFFAWCEKIWQSLLLRLDFPSYAIEKLFPETIEISVIFFVGILFLIFLKIIWEH